MAAFLGDEAEGFLGGLFVGAVVDCGEGSFLGQFACDAPADSAAGSCDQGCFAYQSFHVAALLVVGGGEVVGATGQWAAGAVGSAG